MRTLQQGATNSEPFWNLAKAPFANSSVASGGFQGSNDDASGGLPPPAHCGSCLDGQCTDSCLPNVAVVKCWSPPPCGCPRAHVQVLLVNQEMGLGMPTGYVILSCMWCPKNGLRTAFGFLSARMMQGDRYITTQCACADHSAASIPTVQLAQCSVALPSTLFQHLPYGQLPSWREPLQASCSCSGQSDKARRVCGCRVGGCGGLPPGCLCHLRSVHGFAPRVAAGQQRSA
jgi:hypothetical protein